MSDKSPIPQLFHKLFSAKNEVAVDAIIANYPELFEPQNWFPLGGNESNFGVIENQQSNPVAAIVEKLTNAIDAILMRRCYESGIDPKSSAAPHAIADAIMRFFPNHKNWDLSGSRNTQAESTQIIADSLPRDTANTSLIIYDDGEGQHPEEFENTFLSLLRGNKNEIHFVQGKYNMGGSGAIVFCGKKRYQLIASKRFDNLGLFGFTLVRKHPLTEAETKTKKNTWYEYLKITGKIPAFPIDELDLGLYNRRFKTGTIIKLYSYDVKGNRHVRRDLRKSLNEFLYEPALPIYTVETAERYPEDRGLKAVMYGLKRNLSDDKDYIEETFSEVYTDKQIGRMKVTIHVFKARTKDRTTKETRDYIQREFFKNNMTVLFSVNGQVHGHYTSEFITRSLKFNLLRDYLLIHVDCTEMNYEFRSELFMASRDRLKQGEESSLLRQVLANNLKSGQLHDIYKRRKDNISVDIAEDDSLLKSFAENLPINPEMRQLLSKTFKLEKEDKPPTPKPRPNVSNPKTEKTIPPFKPQRFPTFFKLDANVKGDTPVVQIPLNGEKTIRFNSDVENQYFDRTEEPGDMKIAIMKHTPNQATGGNAKGTVNDISDILTVTRRSPQEGAIKVVLKPSEEIRVGDAIQVQVDLTSPGKDFTQILWVKITDEQAKPKQQVMVPEEEKIGLPKLIKVYQAAPDDSKLATWEQLAESSIEMNYDTVIHPAMEGEILETVYINMDSHVLKNYKSSIRSIEQHQVAERRYVAAIYFHTLFLYVINKNRGYQMSKSDENLSKEVDLADYLRDVFSSHYAEFLLSFGMSDLVDALG